ncbi:MAG: prepilin peptidase [Elusimicrobia bacterium]|nr:prepilin peptidase [Elusimicrobiota bacterium]
MIEFLVFWLGLIAGSFMNVCIHRLPEGGSLVRPRSRCPKCKTTIAWYDNVPVVSWVLLGAKCRKCRKPISARYPAVELLTALLYVALWRRWEGDVPFAAAACAATGVLVVIAYIDWDTFLIPDVLSLGLLAAGLAAAGINPLFSGSVGMRYAWSFLGALTGFAVCWGTAVMGEWAFKKEAMGGGDIKLLAAVGAWTGALGAFDCLIVASMFGAIYGVWLIAAKRLKRQDPIPFGPFLSAAAIFNFFYILPFGFPFEQ